MVFKTSTNQVRWSTVYKTSTIRLDGPWCLKHQPIRFANQSSQPFSEMIAKEEACLELGGSYQLWMSGLSYKSVFR